MAHIVTIRDIARQADVSVSTASRALNNNTRISLKTRDRIHKIATEMGYVPNYNAKNLSAGEANAVGVVFPVTGTNFQDNPFYIELLQGINQELVSHNYVLSIAIGENPEATLANVRSMVTQSKIKRFILLYATHDDPVANYLREEGIRFVLIGAPEAHPEDLYVNNDNVQAGGFAAEQLITEHHAQHPLFLQTAYDWRYESHRRQGYEQALLAHGLDTLIYQVPKEDSKEHHEQFSQFLADHPEIDAIEATDDSLAIANYRFYAPRNLPVIAFNNTPLITQADMPIDSIDIMPVQLGCNSVKLLFAKTPLKKIIVPFEFVAAKDA